MTATTPPIGNSRLRQSCIRALKTGAVAIVVGAVFGAIYFATLPGTESSDSNNHKTSMRQWKRALVTPVAKITLIVLPITCATASFASSYPPRPVSLIQSIMVTATVAAMAHITTASVKGPPNISIILTSVIISAAILIAWGFRAESE